MDYILSLFLILNFASIGRGQGYNGCKSADWRYHYGSHTCFRLFRYLYTWYGAKSHCRAFWGDIDYKSHGLLARIDDEETNTFVKGVLGSESEAWIGLNNHVQYTRFRWQGYPEKEPRYLNFQTPPNGRSQFSAIITSAFWKTIQPNNGRYFICQLKAEIPRTNITCPPAVEQNQVLAQPIKCQFYFNLWKSVTWFRQNTALSSCSKGTTSCVDRKIGFRAQMSGKTSVLYYDGVVSRDMADDLKCSVIATNNKHLDTKTCALQVYVPPSPIVCSNVLTRYKLQMSCQTEKVYPQASCQWFYKNQADESYHTVSQNEATGQSHEDFHDSNDDDLYFKSVCSVNLTRKGTLFKAGVMFVKVIMYPTVTDSHLSTRAGASETLEDAVVIELPRKPDFTINDQHIQETAFLNDGEQMTLLCQVKSGKPTVQTTTLSCGFPITPKGDKSENTWKGISYRIQQTVQRQMHGKTCTCWGQHITGSTETTTIQFNVLFAASVQVFTANQRQTQLTVDVHTQVTLRCQSAGNPVPSVEIVKDDVLEIDEKENGLYATHFSAKCSDNSRYQCLAKNQVNGRTYTDGRDLDVHVRCMPTLCDDHDPNPSVVARLRKEALIEMCVVAYPVPIKNSFYLSREPDNNGKKGAVMDKTKYDLEYTTTRIETVSGIKIRFFQIGPQDHGNYTLHYSGSGSVPSSKLHFQLSSKGPPECPQNVTVTGVGHNYVSLSWIPGYDNGYDQTFVFSLGYEASSSDSMTPKELVSEGETQMAFNLTGFSPETNYFVRVDAKNQEGNTTCPENVVNFTTGMKPKPLSGSDSNVGTILAVVFTIIILVIIVAASAAFLFIRRRKQRAFNYRQASYSASGASNGDGTPLGTRTQGSVRIQPKAHTDQNPTQVDEYETEKHVYNNDADDYTYNNMEDNVYNNVDCQEETEYANTITNQPESPTVDPSPQPVTAKPIVVELESRKNEDGLIYMDVVIDPTDQRPKLKQETEKKAPIPVEEPVDYSSIDLLATAVALIHEDEISEDS